MKEKLDLVKLSKIVLFEGFFIAFSYDIALKVINHCKRHGITVAINISGVYVVTNHHEKLIHCLSMCDIVIGNQSEFLALSETLKLSGDSIAEKAKHLQKRMLSGLNGIKPTLTCMEKWKKIVIITNNRLPVTCVFGNGDLIEYDVPQINPNEIVDTTGGGDSFLGGFLYSLVSQKSIKKCIEAGCIAATAVIQEHGYTIRDSVSSMIR